VLTLFLGAIARISRFVGGIGIMNIMPVSITERTRDTGIRKAVGATKGEILLRFLLEVIVLSFLSNLLGTTRVTSRSQDCYVKSNTWF
jgi:putative ABC transport system permease protein